GPILRTAVRTLRAIKRPLHKPVPRWRDGFGTSMKRLRSHLAQSGLTGIARGLLRRFERAIARWRDEALDRKYDIDTRGIVEAYATDHIGEHGEHSTGHEPIQRLLFARMLKLLPGDIRQFTFADFVSGTGRAAIHAAHW